jgi:hypothetical protein
LAIACLALALAPGARPLVALPMQRPDKSTLTAAQRKLDSRLLREVERRRADSEVERRRADAAPAGPLAEAGVKVDKKNRALVDVRATVTASLKDQIDGLGGTIVSSSVDYHSIVAWVPLAKLEQLAEDPAVRAIVPPSGAATNAIKK